LSAQLQPLGHAARTGERKLPRPQREDQRIGIAGTACDLQGLGAYLHRSLVIGHVCELRGQLAEQSRAQRGVLATERRERFLTHGCNVGRQVELANALQHQSRLRQQLRPLA